MVVVDSPPVALRSSICLQTSVHLCTPDQVSIQCCHQGLWVALEEGGLPTLGSACPHSSSMDRADTRSTAHHYLVVEALEGPRMALYLQ